MFVPPIDDYDAIKDDIESLAGNEFYQPHSIGEVIAALREVHAVR